MVRKCKICRKPYQLLIGESRSFHKFPKEEKLKRKWCQVLRLHINEVSKFTEICSDHFSPDQFVVRSNRKYLKKGTIPEIQYSLPDLDTPGTSNSYITTHLSPSEADESSNSSETFSNSPTETDEKVSVVAQPTTSTLTTHNLSSLDRMSTLAETKNMNQSEKSLLKKRFIGDCNSGDMDNPEYCIKQEEIDIKLEQDDSDRCNNHPQNIDDCNSTDPTAPRSWDAVKSMIAAQRKEIKNLQRTKRRLQKKIMCLKSLLMYLKQQLRISEHAEASPPEGTDLISRVSKVSTKEK